MERSVFVVVGARGGTGREIVRDLLQIKDNKIVSEVRALVRDPRTVATGTFPEDDTLLTTHAADCAKPETLVEPFRGARAVFYAAAGRGYEGCKAVDREGPREAAKIAKEAGVDRFVLVSSQLVDPINYYSFVRGFLNTINTGLFHWKGVSRLWENAGEQHLHG